jgi:hypothetical protein
MDFLQVGGPGNNATQSYNFGSTQALRGGNMGDLIVSELHGPAYEAAYRGSLFTGGSQAVVATALQTGLTTTATGGLILNNPIGNTKNLVLRSATVGLILAQTNASVIGIGVGYSASVAIAGTLTVIASQPCLVGPGGPAASSGILYSSASVTLQATPVLARILGSVSTGALTVDQETAIGPVDLQGSIVLQPGAFACFTSSAAGTASSMFFSFTWEEVPI